VLSRASAVILSLLAAMLLGSAMTATASAEEAGPFWHHRPKGKEGEGTKIEPNAPENFRGSGGEQTLKTKVAKEEIEITSSGVQIKGAIFNGPLRGQIKAELVYKQPELRKPKLPGCNVAIGTSGILQAKGYLMWKWNGEKKQLAEPPGKEQTPDWIFSSDEPPIQKPLAEKISLTKNGGFIIISLSGSGCGPLAGKLLVQGSYVLLLNRGLNEFFRTIGTRVIEPPAGSDVFLQHYWTGAGMQGAEVGLEFAFEPASYFIGQNLVETEQQEVAIFE
jgi:hypothetical protein